MTSEQTDFATVGGVLMASSIFQDAAIVGALAEAGVLHPLRVVAWADTLASGLPDTMNPEYRAASSRR